MEHNEFNEDIDVVTPDGVLEALTDSSSDLQIKKEINDFEFNFQPPKVEYDAIGEFCFESDELALKGNADYKNILEAIVVLEAQRAKAVRDLDQLQRLKEEALADPFGFVDRMSDIRFPVAQRIHPVPQVDWGKYAVNGNPSVFEGRQISQQRRQAHEYSRNKKAKLHVGTNEEKPSKTNHQWSVPELSRLKKLLKEFPPEKEEGLRWKKIATALGAHTPLEVVTKIYEDFTSLNAELGDALGALPDLNALKMKLGLSNREDVSNPNRGSTTEEVEENAKASQRDISDDEEISPELQDSPEYKELLMLKRALREKVSEESSGSAQHVGYKCCRCKSDPIVGTRWRCVDCRPPITTDFCEDCAGSSYEMGGHTCAHRLEKQGRKGFLDRDYMRFLGGDYNYLDPNYMPAT